MTLANGYILNTSCAEKRGLKLQSLRDWKLEQEKIYNGSNK